MLPKDTIWCQGPLIGQCCEPGKCCPGPAQTCCKEDEHCTSSRCCPAGKEWVGPPDWEYRSYSRAIGWQAPCCLPGQRFVGTQTTTFGCCDATRSCNGDTICCPEGQVCTTGHCCPTGSIWCGGRCCDVSTGNNKCCEDKCVDIQTDVNNCGDCGRVIPADWPYLLDGMITHVKMSCVGGKPTCPSGFVGCPASSKMECCQANMPVCTGVIGLVQGNDGQIYTTLCCPTNRPKGVLDAQGFGICVA